MSVKPILTEPNKLLRQISKPVENVGDEERRLMDDMLDTMYAANGIGLAAIQIGIPKRIIVMDIGKDPEKKEPRYPLYDKFFDYDGDGKIDLRNSDEKLQDSALLLKDRKKFTAKKPFKKNNKPRKRY